MAVVAPMPSASESTAVAVNDGRAEKRARGEAEIVHEIPQPSGQPDVAHFLPDLREAAEFQHGLPARFRAPADRIASDR